MRPRRSLPARIVHWIPAAFIQDGSPFFEPDKEETMNPKSNDRGNAGGQPGAGAGQGQHQGQQPGNRANQPAASKPGAPKLPRVDDRPASEPKQGDQGNTGNTGKTVHSPDIPDYGDQESGDPRRTDVEAGKGTRPTGNTGKSGSDQGPVQTPNSPSM